MRKLRDINEINISIKDKIKIESIESDVDVEFNLITLIIEQLSPREQAALSRDLDYNLRLFFIETWMDFWYSVRDTYIKKNKKLDEEEISFI